MRITTAIAALLLLAPAGCSHEPKPTRMAVANSAFDDLRKAVRAEVKEAGRAEQLVGTCDELEQLVDEAGKHRQATWTRLRALHADYDTGPEQFRALFREMGERQAARQRRLLEIDARAKALTTADEWKHLTKAIGRAIGSSAQVVGGT